MVWCGPQRGSIVVGYVLFVFFFSSLAPANDLSSSSSPHQTSTERTLAKTAFLCSTLALLLLSFSANCLSTPVEPTGYVDICAARLDAMSERIVDMRPKKNVNPAMMAVRRTMERE